MSVPLFYIDSEKTLLEVFRPLKSVWESHDFRVFSCVTQKHLYIEGINVLSGINIICDEATMNLFADINAFGNPEQFVWDQVIKGLTPDLLKWLVHKSYRCGRDIAKQQEKANNVASVGGL